MPDDSAAPVAAILFAYKVGFGDCFLLRFSYADATTRHVLIDFGTTGLTIEAPAEQMVLIANDIAEKCSNKLDVVVATHRHADHISGFATRADGKGSGDIIRSLKPTVVVQPWTEAPDAPLDWMGPESEDREQAFALRRQSLAEMEKIATLARDTVDAGQLRVPKAVADQMHFIGEDNIANKSAVSNLMTMGEKNAFVFHGCDAGLGEVLPGVGVTVLGPPTLRQTETISKQRARDKDEFWHLAPLQFAHAVGAVETDDADDDDDDQGKVRSGRIRKASALFPAADVRLASKLPAEARWVADRVDQANGEMMLGLVRALDAQMNNTSVILLFKAGSKKLLFPGDAQLENWRYALQSDLAPLLDDVDLYKVGHHGSLNATPKSMWNRFGKRGARDKPDRLTSVMSTRDGKHGSIDSGTEVPRSKLVTELETQSTLVDTRDLPEDALCSVIEIDLR